MLKKPGKTTRPFRYDLNQIPYKDTVEVTNRFKGLDLIDRLPEELWTEVPDVAQKAVIKNTPKKKKCKKAKWLSEEALQIAEKRREVKDKEMGIPDHLTCLLRNLYVDQEATVRTLYEINDWFKIEKGVRLCCHPLCLPYTVSES